MTKTTVSNENSQATQSGITNPPSDNNNKVTKKIGNHTYEFRAQPLKAEKTTNKSKKKTETITQQPSSSFQNDIKILLDMLKMSDINDKSASSSEFEKSWKSLVAIANTGDPLYTDMLVTAMSNIDPTDKSEKFTDKVNKLFDQKTEISNDTLIRIFRKLRGNVKKSAGGQKDHIQKFAENAFTSFMLRNAAANRLIDFLIQPSVQHVLRLTFRDYFEFIEKLKSTLLNPENWKSLLTEKEIKTLQSEIEKYQNNLDALFSQSKKAAKILKKRIDAYWADPDNALKISKATAEAFLILAYLYAYFAKLRTGDGCRYMVPNSISSTAQVDLEVSLEFADKNDNSPVIKWSPTIAGENTQVELAISKETANNFFNDAGINELHLGGSTKAKYKALSSLKKHDAASLAPELYTHASLLDSLQSLIFNPSFVLLPLINSNEHQATKEKYINIIKTGIKETLGDFPFGLPQNELELKTSLSNVLKKLNRDPEKAIKDLEEAVKEAPKEAKEAFEEPLQRIKASMTKHPNDPLMATLVSTSIKPLIIKALGHFPSDLPQDELELKTSVSGALQKLDSKPEEALQEIKVLMKNFSDDRIYQKCKELFELDSFQTLLIEILNLHDISDKEIRIIENCFVTRNFEDLKKLSKKGFGNALYAVVEKMGFSEIIDLNGLQKFLMGAVSSVITWFVPDSKVANASKEMFEKEEFTLRDFANTLRGFSEQEKDNMIFSIKNTISSFRQKLPANVAHSFENAFANTNSKFYVGLQSVFTKKIEELVNRNAKDDHQKSLNQWVLGLMAVMHSNDSREAIEAFYSTARKLFASLSSQVMTPEKRAKLNIQEEDMAFIDFIILRPRLDDIDDNVFQKLIDRFYYCVDAVLKKPAETTFERPKKPKDFQFKDDTVDAKEFDRAIEKLSHALINGEETYDEVLVRTLQQLCGLEDELDLTDEHVRTLVNMMATSDVSDIMAKYTESNANQNQDGNITDTNNTSNEDSEPELRNKLICERIVRLLLKDSDTDSNDNNSLSHEARLHFGLSAAIILNQPNLINKFIHNYFEKMKAIKKPAKEDIATFLREVIDVVRKVFAERRAKYVNNYQGLFDAVRLGDAKLFKKALSKINGLDLSFVLANFGNPFTKSPLTVEHLTAELIQVSELSTDNKSKDHYRNKYVYVRPSGALYFFKNNGDAILLPQIKNKEVFQEKISKLHTVVKLDSPTFKQLVLGNLEGNIDFEFITDWIVIETQETPKENTCVFHLIDKEQNRRPITLKNPGKVIEGIDKFDKSTYLDGTLIQKIIVEGCGESHYQILLDARTDMALALIEHCKNTKQLYPLLEFIAYNNDIRSKEIQDALSKALEALGAKSDTEKNDKNGKKKKEHSGSIAGSDESDSKKYTTFLGFSIFGSKDSGHAFTSTSTQSGSSDLTSSNYSPLTERYGHFSPKNAKNIEMILNHEKQNGQAMVNYIHDRLNNDHGPFTTRILAMLQNPETKVIPRAITKKLQDLKQIGRGSDSISSGIARAMYNELFNNVLSTWEVCENKISSGFEMTTYFDLTENPVITLRSMLTDESKSIADILTFCKTRLNGDIKLLADQMTLLTNPKKLKIELMKSTKANEIYRKELQRFSSRKSSASDNNNSEAANHPANENQPPIIISRIKELVALKANTDFAKMPDFAFDAVKQNIINNLTEFYRLIKHGEEKESQLVQEVLGLLNIPIDQKYLPTANSTSSNSSTNSGLVM